MYLGPIRVRSIIGGLGKAALIADNDSLKPNDDMQLDMVLRLGVSPDRIVFANACKRPRDIRAAANKQVLQPPLDVKAACSCRASIVIYLSVPPLLSGRGLCTKLCHGSYTCLAL